MTGSDAHARQGILRGDLLDSRTVEPDRPFTLAAMTAMVKLLKSENELLHGRMERIEATLKRLESSRAPAPAPLLPETLNVSQAADRCGLDPRTIKKAIARGHLRAAEIGNGQERRAFKISVDAMREWLAGRRGQA